MNKVFVELDKMITCYEFIKENTNKFTNSDNILMILDIDNTITYTDCGYVFWPNIKKYYDIYKDLQLKNSDLDINLCYVNIILSSKIDVFDTFDEIKVCVAYKDCRNDKVYTSYPTDVFIHKYLEPIYETMEGWKTSLSNIRKYEDLPENAKKYIARVEDLIGAPIGIISVGPDREQTIFIN